VRLLVNEASIVQTIILLLITELQLDKASANPGTSPSPPFYLDLINDMVSTTLTSVFVYLVICVKSLSPCLSNYYVRFFNVLVNYIFPMSNVGSHGQFALYHCFKNLLFDLVNKFSVHWSIAGLAVMRDE